MSREHVKTPYHCRSFTFRHESQSCKSFLIIEAYGCCELTNTSAEENNEVAEGDGE